MTEGKSPVKNLSHVAHPTGSLYPREPLGCCVYQVFDEDAISGGGVVDKNVGHGANEFSILDNRAAGHACVKNKTTCFLAMDTEVLPTLAYFLV